MAYYHQEATLALTTLSQTYTGTDWVTDIGNTLIHECINAATKFVDHNLVVSDFIHHSPMDDFNDYLKTVKSGKLQESSILPTLLQLRKKPPPALPYVPTQDTGNNALKRRRKELRQTNNRCRCTKTQGPTIHFKRTQPPAIQALLKQLKVKSTYWTLSSLCQANNITCNANLTTALGLKMGNCLKS